MMDEPEIMFCGHCGNSVPFKKYGEYKYEVSDPNYEAYWCEVTVHLLECQTCSHPTLKQTYVSSEDNDFGPFHSPKVLYPVVSKVQDNIPPTIQGKYKEALKVRHVSPSACAILVGRTLEAICTYEKAVGKDLFQRIENLVSSEHIPKTLAEMAHQLRQIRNLGAHDAEDDVTEEDVKIILDFMEAILEYLYIAPAKIEVMKKRLSK